MSAADRFQNLLDRCVELIPGLLEDSESQAPDLETALKSLDLSVSVTLSLMKLRKTEQEMGDLTGPVSVDQAMSVLLGTSIEARRKLLDKLQKSIPQKGMKP
jgi:hypothetical protein